MKKYLLTILLLCLSLSACSKKEEPSTTTGLSWDCVEFTTVEELNLAANTNIVTAPIAGKSDEWFGLISDSIAQYKFNANGEEWCVRASKDVDNDISGLYYDSIGFEKDMTSTYYTDDVYLFRFFYDDTQYCISLDVKDKEISTGHFDDVCNEFKTNITGVKSGYENEIIEDGDDVIYRVVIYNDDGTTMTMDTVYTFENDKMSKIVSNITFETTEALKAYVEDLKEYGNSTESLIIEGTTLSSDSSTNIDFYSDYTKAEFISMMKGQIS